MNLRHLALLTALSSLAALPVSASVMNFDDIDTSGGPTPIPTSYNGFTWSSDFYVLNGPSYTFVPPSSPNVAFNAFGVSDVTVSSATPFDFDGADFTGWPFANSGTLSITGWNGATLVGTVVISNPDSFSFTWANVNLDNVTSLDFSNGGFNQEWWLMDDFTYNANGSVPDSGTTAALLALGLAGLAVAARRRSVEA